MTSIVPLDSSLLPAATRALAGAFGDDPAFSFTFGNEGGNAERLLPFFGKMLTIGLARGTHIDVAGNGAAVAMWKGPDSWKDSVMVQLRLAPTMARTIGRRLPQALRMFAAIEKQHPDPPHLYLAFLGTHPDHQGQGLGGAVLAPTLERCDREGLPAYLESSNPRNVPFYARHGFVERAPIDLPDGWPVITPMWREPR